MKEFKGTKGEWKILNDDNHTPNVLIQAKDKYGCTWNILEVYNQYEDNEHVANIKLIAAAPDLLKALQGFVNIEDLYIPSGHIEPEHQSEAIVLGEALMKAKGAISKALD